MLRFTALLAAAGCATATLKVDLKSMEEKAKVKAVENPIEPSATPPKTDPTALLAVKQKHQATAEPSSDQSMEIYLVSVNVKSPLEAPNDVRDIYYDAQAVDPSDTVLATFNNREDSTVEANIASGTLTENKLLFTVDVPSAANEQFLDLKIKDRNGNKDRDELVGITNVGSVCGKVDVYTAMTKADGNGMLDTPIYLSCKIPASKMIQTGSVQLRFTKVAKVDDGLAGAVDQGMDVIADHSGVGGLGFLGALGAAMVMARV